MIDANQIPLEVRNAISAARKNGASSAEIAAAAINAWPGALEQQFYELTPDGKQMTFPVIILPLPQKEPSE